MNNIVKKKSLVLPMAVVAIIILGVFMKNLIKKIINFCFIITIAVIGFSITGCSNEPGDTNSVSFSGTDLGGNEYTLTIYPDSDRTARNSSSGQGNKYGHYKIKVKSNNGNESESTGDIIDILDDTYTLQKSENDQEFTVTASNNVISSIVGNITLDNGQTFIVRTFDKIYMRAHRWDAGDSRGEQYSTSTSIKLKDIFDGDLDELLSKPLEEILTLKLSGHIDTRLDLIKFEIHHLPYDDPADEDWTFLGDSFPPNSTDYVVIDSGEFNKEFNLKSLTDGKQTLNTPWNMSR